MLSNSIPDDVSLVLPAPAKINLFLHILGKRDDGYHNLQTLFQFLNHADTLAFNPRSDSQIILHTHFNNVAHDDNLIVKAAKLLQQYTQCSLGADIWIDKHLPMGGGLGGGSSNAATTLLGLNVLWNTQLNLEALSTLGLKLGADVPVFIQGKAAFAEGIGEQLTPVTISEQWYLVTIPDVSISTARIFNDPELPRNTPAISYSQALTLTGHNDCQSVVEKYYPEVKAALNLLEELGPTLLTGTGACLFTIFNSEQQANQAQQKLPIDFKSFIAQGLNNSPLHTTLKENNLL